jgi:hypothetical protein
MKRLMGIFASAAESKVMFYGAMERFLDENIGH